MTSYVIGIDLGTTNTCVAVVIKDRVEIIINEEGSRTFPSMVCFADDEIYIGCSAQQKASEYPDRTIYDVKRLIGYNFSDKIVQNEIKNFPFPIVNQDDDPKIEIFRKRTKQFYCPEHISGMVLRHAKKIAEKKLGQSVEGAVITVPAYFNNLQRSATMDAAKIANLKVLKIITEPNAAALAYGWENKNLYKTVLIYDLGGGTFDISIVKINGSAYEVIATLGDTHLGGADFTNNIVDYIKNQCAQKHNIDITSDEKMIGKLRKICEKKKKQLSAQRSVNLHIKNSKGDLDTQMELSRAKFEELNYGLFQKSIDTIDNCLEDAALTKNDIDEIILVGGSSRIPKIQEMLKNHFGTKKLLETINPDEAVACGAAVQAAMLEGKIKFRCSIQIIDVTPLSLGIGVLNDKMDFVINRNTQIPCKSTKPHYTGIDDQDIVEFSIYQGERRLASENALLGKYIISNLPKRPKGEVTFHTTFSLDENGILKCDSVVQGTSLKGNVKIRLVENRLSENEIKRIVKEAQEMEAEDLRRIAINKAKYDLESYCRNTKTKAELLKTSIAYSKRTKIIDCCNDGINKVNEFTQPFQMEDLLKEIRSICDPILGDK